MPRPEARRGRGVHQRRRGPSREAPHRTESNPFGSGTPPAGNPACDRLSPTRAGLPSRNTPAHRRANPFGGGTPPAGTAHHVIDFHQQERGCPREISRPTESNPFGSGIPRRGKPEPGKSLPQGIGSKAGVKSLSFRRERAWPETRPLGRAWLHFFWKDSSPSL